MKFIVSALFVAGLLFAACGDGDGGSGDFDATARPRPTSTAQPLSDGNPPGIPVLSGEIVATASGLRYIDEQPGVGPSPSATHCVRVRYTGWFTDGRKFDSSMGRGTQISFPLSGSIAGWVEGIGGMKEGGKRRLIIPSEMAYGERGRADVIGPNMTLIYDIELIEVGEEPAPGVGCSQS